MKPLLFIFFILMMGCLAYAQPRYASHPKAAAVLFLDFDGHWVEGTLWNGDSSFSCLPALLPNEAILEIFHRVAEDFRPFDLNVTTDSLVYANAPFNQKLRVVITPSHHWYPAPVGGVAFTGSFTWGDETPAFVFVEKLAYRSKLIAECISHEAGHALGLSHQSRYNECQLITMYHEGEGSGQTGWAPIMGNSYGRNVSKWNNGPTPAGCTEREDNLALLTSLNGFGYREDDHGDEINRATPLETSGGILTGKGIISMHTDQDVFSFTMHQTGKLRLQIVPFSVGPQNEGANLDVRAVLLDARQTVIGVYDGAATLDVVVDTLLAPGAYFVVVTGGDSSLTTTYGSLGSYSITGFIAPASPLPAISIRLEGEKVFGGYQLSWHWTGDVPATWEVQGSPDGVDFQHLQILYGKPSRAFVLHTGARYYRLKTTVGNQVYYSNIWVVRTPEEKQWKLVHRPEGLQIEAAASFRYQIYDLQGRCRQSGEGKPGMNRVYTNKLAKGLFIIRMWSNEDILQERFLRL